MDSFRPSIKAPILIIGSLLPLLIVAAARNSLTWHLTNIWGLSHDFWQTLWIKVLVMFNYNAPILFIIGTSGVASVSFWMYNAFLLFIDLTGKPTFLQAYKIQEEKNVPVDRERVYHCVRVVLRNQVIAVIVTALFYPLFQWRGMLWDSPLPTFQRVMLELAGCIIVEEIGFYYFHRLLHHPVLYKRIHKIHHEWTAPIGIVGLYCHPVENILSNAIPVLLGPTITGAHLATLWLWVTVAAVNTTNAHSGYHFPCFPSPEQHDYHHLKFNQCFGFLGILDYLHNTDGKFRASKNFQRHVRFFSLTPVKDTFPDDPKRSKSD